MNALDIVIGLVLLFGAWRGYKNGLVMEVCTLLAIGLGIWLAINFSDRVADWLSPRMDLGTWLGPAAFAITFLGVLLGVNLLGRMITKAMDVAMLSLPNRLAGAAFCVLKYGLILSVLLNVCEGFDPEEKMIKPVQKQSSKLYFHVRDFAPFAVPAIKDSKWVKATMDKAKELDVLPNEAEKNDGS